ncbi:MAG: hypothetical protein CVU91_03920 [Firmicutes bacterium HGW-Firmicutes-16]|nr:MAG: hypothetical protein CVU91_03920 [Firmicutes bacterium HGW-Firmicutes-16]
MTTVEILNKIVEAEGNARAISDEASKLKECFDSYVNEHIEVLRKQFFEKAEKVIAQAKNAEAARADAEIVELDKKLETELATLKAFYDKERETIVQKIFKLAVDADA